jgi:hypothetical protein
LFERVRIRRPEELRVGDVVQVRSKEEILATLDSDGRLDGMPFMPEMLQFAGQTIEVAKRAHKACDTTADMGIRDVPAAVHLAGARCDGSAHDGCQASCLLFWKEAWLKRPGDPAAAAASIAPTITESELQAKTRVTVPATDGETTGRLRFVCQATALREYTKPLPFWRPKQYVTDVASGNITLRSLAIGLVFLAANKYQDLTRDRLPRWLLIYGGRRVPSVLGTLERTPKRELGLQPGERVRVKSQKEIRATLDQLGRNRGLQFDAELLEFCDREATVARRISRLIDEKSGEMIQLPNECIMLDGFLCAGRYHRFCQRGSIPFWREIWLERVSGDEGAARTSKRQP